MKISNNWLKDYISTDLNSEKIETEAAVIRAVRDSGAGALVVSHRSAVLAAADEVVTL